MALHKLLLWKTTEKAVLVSRDENKAVEDYWDDEKFWLPKSHIKDCDDIFDDFDGSEPGVVCSIEVPQWLAEKNDL